MTLTEMRDRARSVVRDTAKEFITDADLTAWINEAYLDLVTRFGLLKKEFSIAMGAAGTSVVDGTVDLPADFIAMTKLRLAGETGFPVSDDDWWMYSDGDADPSPPVFRVFNEKLEIFPAPSTGTAIRLRYVYQPTALAASDSIPAVSEELHHLLIRYAQAQAKYKKHEFEAGDRYLQMYESGMRDARPRDREMPGPLVMTMEGGPFDHSEATHI